MTVVNFDLRDPDGTPAVGSLLFSPTKRLGVDDHIIVPHGFVIELVDGAAAVELLPNTPDWAWSIIERVKGGIRRYVAVTDSPTPVQYTGLIDVDPTTLTPTADPEAAWWAVAGGLQAAADSADVDAAAADASRIAAQTAETGAVAARTGAETAQTGAQTARTGAETARDAAQAINAVTVTTGTVTGDNLILTRTNATTVDAGNVRGPKGDSGDTTPADLATATTTYTIINGPKTAIRVLAGNVTPNPLPTPYNTVAFTNTLIFRQAASGGPYTVAFPTAIEWANDAPAPTMPTVPNSELMVHILWTGAGWRGMVGGIFFP